MPLIEYFGCHDVVNVPLFDIDDTPRLTSIEVDEAVAEALTIPGGVWRRVTVNAVRAARAALED